MRAEYNFGWNVHTLKAYNDRVMAENANVIRAKKGDGETKPGFGSASLWFASSSSVLVRLLHLPLRLLLLLILQLDARLSSVFPSSSSTSSHSCCLVNK